MASSRVQLLSENLVKPSSPTPRSLRHYKLSLMDQLMTDNYIPFAFFYPNHEGRNLSPDTTQTSSILEKSLSNLLTSYYPFAGRLVENVLVDCNDMGATFIEARSEWSMSHVLKDPDLSSVDNTVFPSGLAWRNPREVTSLLVAQLTHFNCGGKALSICMSHKLGDAVTAMNFVSDWAAMAHQFHRGIAVTSPEFITTSLYPPANDPKIEPVYTVPETKQFTCTRVAMSGSQISHLKATVAAESSGSVHNPTKFEAVTAFLTKSAVTASKATSGSFKPLLVRFNINLRRLTTPPLPPRAVGNILLVNNEVPFLDEGEMKLSTIVSKIRGKKVEIYKKYEGMKRNELVSAVLEEKEMEIENDQSKFDTYVCASLCNYPLYNVDFGWGRPARVGCGPPAKNSFIVIDNPNGDGVEAFVSLDEQAMSIFQSDPEIHAFASFDPSIQGN